MSTSGPISRIETRLPEFAAIRRDIHKHPETAYEEFRTSAIVADALASYGLEVVTGIGGTGVVGVLRAGDSERAIGLRADMDALDMEELNEFEHRSIRRGKMHGCGHDGHTAALLAAAACLAERPDFEGTVYFIFQPAEEGRAGAQKMIDDGLFERFPMTAIFGLHNVPGIPIGKFALKTGAMMAGADRFDIIIEGRGGHAAMPHLGNDPVVAAGALIQALQTIVARNMDPMQSAVLSITRIEGGSAFNVTPDRVELSGTVRFFDKAAQALVERRMAEMVDLVVRGHGCRSTLHYEKLFPATVNATEETLLCARVLAELVGEGNVNTDPVPQMASEDFAFMLEAKPGCYIWAGNGEDEASGGLHSPHYDFNDELIPYAAGYWLRLVEAALPPAHKSV
jgi:amidohydrolase